MTTDQGEYRGHACIVIGDAQEVVKNKGLHAQVNTLVALLRRGGVNEKYLKSVAVVLHPTTKFVGGGGRYCHNSELTYRATKASPLWRFSSVLHIYAFTDRSLPFVLLHEAGHLRAFSRGRGGRALYSQRNQRLVRIVGYFLAAISFVAVMAAIYVWTPWFVQVPIWLSFVLGILMMYIPEMMLWSLSSAEWKANQFYWRHKKYKLISTDTDGTPHFFVDDAVIKF